MHFQNSKPNPNKSLPLYIEQNVIPALLSFEYGLFAARLYMLPVKYCHLLWPHMATT